MRTSWICLGSALLLAGCAPPRRYEAAMAPPAPVMMMDDAPSSSLSMKLGSRMYDEAPAARPGAVQQQVQLRSRQQIFESWVRLRATQPAEVLDSAESLVRSMGGFLEARQEGRADLRVPVDSFFAAFARVQSMGVLLGKNLEAQDATAEFQNTVRRISILRSTVERLNRILAREKDLERRKKLMLDVQGVAEELEGLERRRDVLSRQAAYSLLTVEVQSFQAGASVRQESIGALQWIASLDARREVEDSRLRRRQCFWGRLELATPPGMVALEKPPSKYAAVASDGTELWTRCLPNEPRGDGAFWREAIRLRLESGFAQAETFEAGRWKLLRLQSHGVHPHVLWVGVRSAKGRLHLARAFFPAPENETAWRERIVAALRKDAP